MMPVGLLVCTQEEVHIMFSVTEASAFLRYSRVNGAYIVCEQRVV